MAQQVIQTAFASGEWAPKLRSRVDIQKYRYGAAYLRNFYVDFAGGGASTRTGSKFIAQAGALGARLISFQAGSSLGYVLEFGQNYIRFYSNGAQVMSGGVPYQISTPYAAGDLFPNPNSGNPGLKYVQDATSIIICHPSYAPAILTINGPTNWTFTLINFGPTITTPAAPVITSTSVTGGGWNYAYLVTAVDINGQESGPSIPGTITDLGAIETVAMTNTITWTAVPGAASYNVYKADHSFNTATVSGAPYGFIGNTTGVSFLDSAPGIAADFSQTPPVLQNPFAGSSVLDLTLTGNAIYTTVPSVTIDPPSSGIQAIAFASLAVATIVINHGGVEDIAASGPVVNSLLFLGNGVVVQITGFVGGFITSFQLVSAGSLLNGNTPSNPVSPVSNTIPGFVGYGAGFGFTLTWNIGALVLSSGGEGYTSTPSVTITGGATGTATLGAASLGNPGVPGFLQERLVLAAQAKAIQGYQMSQPASFFNFNTSNPSQADDAISGTILSEQLNDIRSLIAVPTGLVALTGGGGAYLINGGGGLSTSNPITPSNQTANPQAFNGANDLRPQKINLDVIYGTNKGSYFRDLTYNIYANIYTGTDISMLSNHLFFGHWFVDVAWAEEPFKTLWVVREDGIMLSLAFVKEQDLIGWAHHDTDGQYKSVCSVIETVNGSTVDAVYYIVERVINGSTVQYVERAADRYFLYGREDAWCVDCGLQTAGTVFLGELDFSGDASVVGNTVTLSDTTDAPFTAPMAAGNWVVRAGGGIYKITGFTSSSIVTATVTRVPSQINSYTGVPYRQIDGWTLWEPVTTVSGLIQLENQSVVGLVDGTPVGPLTVSSGGSVILPFSGTKIVLGLSYLPQLVTLPLDLGEPTVQGTQKKIIGVVVRVADTLGLQLGTTFANCVDMKDFQINAVPSLSTGVVKVTDLVNPSTDPSTTFIDGWVVMDQAWQEAGNYCVQQVVPWPATILGVLPRVEVAK